MAQTNLTIRIDENIKRDAEILFNNIGLTMSAAINVFFRQAVREQAIPFSIRAATAEQAKAGQIITKTLAELEAMEND